MKVLKNKLSFSDYMLFLIAAASVILFFLSFSIFKAKFFYFTGMRYQAKFLYFNLYAEASTIFVKDYKKILMFIFSILGCALEVFLSLFLFKLDQKLDSETKNKLIHKIISLLFFLNSLMLICETFSLRHSDKVTFDDFIRIFSLVPTFLYLIYFIFYKLTKRNRCKKVTNPL